MGGETQVKGNEVMKQENGKEADRQGKTVGKGQG